VTDAAADHRALEVLVENRHAFLRFLERRVGDRATAEDILQDAFGRAVNHLADLRDDESATAWFYRILRNAVTDHYRRKDSSRRALEALARELDHVDEGSELHGAVCACVARLAATLKPEYASALKSIEVEGMPVSAFAAEQGISPNNAAVRVHRARLALKKQVMASCGACAERGCTDCGCRHP
jgi:RNA polymerase sigma factor (sigma-70 family)